DDTSVAIVDKNTPTGAAAQIRFLENVTADSREYRGIHPILALESHQENLAKLVGKALVHLPEAPTDPQGNDNGGRNLSRQIILADGSNPRQKPDLISATRGPGMRSNLSTGLDTGKALSVAWQIPFVGVHHMQAHLLTPRLVSSLERSKDASFMTKPEFPFLSILVSGGHSILVKSASITEHEVMASSVDIAIGESLDKSAREILPSSMLQDAKNTMYGKILEQFAFPNEVVKRKSHWGWSLTTPFANTRHMQFSFSSIASAVSKLVSLKEKAGQG
ncbi:Mitochondrial tRNAs modification protein, partial [Elasticomyces elasticus]